MNRLSYSAICIGLTILGIISLPGVANCSTPGHEGVEKSRPAFYLHNGDRVVFYGDSITEQRLYTTYIESYCTSRFPNEHFTFVNSGWGGDRVTGGGGGPIDIRLRRDVFAYKPTVVTICLGMNDGSYRAFDQKIFQTYVDGYRHILDEMLKNLPGVRITLVTASAFDDVTRPVGFPGGYNATLVAYGEAVKQLGREYNLTVADTNAPLVSVLDRAETVDAELASKIIPDRVHPGPGGHVMMAAAVLKAWNAPSTVADIEIDAASGRIVHAANSHISKMTTSGGKITFTHLDECLPWPIDRNPDRNKDTLLTLATSYVEQDFNRYRLKIKGLKAASYHVREDGQDLGVVSSADFANGVDLAALPTFAPNVQADTLLGLIRKHIDLHFQRWRNVQVPNSKDGETISSETKLKMDALDANEEEAVKAVWAAVKPHPHTIEISPAE